MPGVAPCPHPCTAYRPRARAETSVSNYPQRPSQQPHCHFFQILCAHPGQQEKPSNDQLWSHTERKRLPAHPPRRAPPRHQARHGAAVQPVRCRTQRYRKSSVPHLARLFNITHSSTTWSMHVLAVNLNVYLLSAFFYFYLSFYI